MCSCLWRKTQHSTWPSCDHPSWCTHWPLFCLVSWLARESGEYSPACTASHHSGLWSEDYSPYRGQFSKLSFWGPGTSMYISVNTQSSSASCPWMAVCSQKDVTISASTECEHWFTGWAQNNLLLMYTENKWHCECTERKGKTKWAEEWPNLGWETSSIFPTRTWASRSL